MAGSWEHRFLPRHWGVHQALPLTERGYAGLTQALWPLWVGEVALLTFTFDLLRHWGPQAGTLGGLALLHTFPLPLATWAEEHEWEPGFGRHVSLRLHSIVQSKSQGQAGQGRLPS